MTGKSFFFGLGAAKCGTSWLFDYLESHPQFQGPSIKELHLFAQAEHGSYLTAVRHLPWHRFAGRKWIRENAYKAWLRADWSRYFALFDRLLSKDGIEATGEFSTSNVQMKPEAVERLVGEMEQRDRRLIVAFLMRDPVDRHLSSARFSIQLHNTNRYRSDIDLSAEQLIEQDLAGDIPPVYARPLQDIIARFDQDQVFVELFEDLFNQATVDRLTDKLGIDRHPASTGKLVNATRDRLPLSDDILEQLARRLAPDYAAAADFLGRERLAQSWPTFAMSGI